MIVPTKIFSKLPIDSAPIMTPLLQYVRTLSPGKTVLWCYLIWYAVTVSYHFESSPKLWLNSAGLSVIIGVGLMLSVAPSGSTKPDRWQTFRLFLMPFCVSTFSALTKGKGFFLIFSPNLIELTWAIGICFAFASAVLLIKHQQK